MSPYTYEWDFGDGATADGAYATHLYEHAKKYAWTVVVTDSEGKTNAVVGEVYCGVPVDPEISQVVKAGSPFRLKVLGRDFVPGCRILVDGVEVPQTAYKKSSKAVAKKGKPLKAMVPIGRSVCIRVENPDGGLSPCFCYTR